MAAREAAASPERRTAMPQERRLSIASRHHPAARPTDTARSPVAQYVLGALFVAAIAVLSLPQARAASAGFGWVPFWLLALPASAWLALQAQRLLLPADRTPASSSSMRRRSLAPASRRRVASGTRGTRAASAA
jgi:hypothetical protein